MLKAKSSSSYFVSREQSEQEKASTLSLIRNKLNSEYTILCDISVFISSELTNHVVHGGWIPTMSPGPIKGPSRMDHGVALDYPVPLAQFCSMGCCSIRQCKTKKAKILGPYWLYQLCGWWNVVLKCKIWSETISLRIMGKLLFTPSEAVAAWCIINYFFFVHTLANFSQFYSRKELPVVLERRSTDLQYFGL